jgi:anthranilate/para-aminobenzoate synthase component I
VPEREYREAESKAAALFRAIEIARAWSRGVE